MKLHEIDEAAAVKPPTVKETDVCVVMNNTAQMLGLEPPAKVGYPAIYPKRPKPAKTTYTFEGRLSDGSHLVLIQDDETGTVEYMTMDPDGHLGSIDG